MRHWAGYRRKLANITRNESIFYDWPSSTFCLLYCWALWVSYAFVLFNIQPRRWWGLGGQGNFYPDFLPQISWGYLASGIYSFNIPFIYFGALSFIIDYFKVWDCTCHKWVNEGIAPRLKIHKPTIFSELGIFQV